MKAIEMEQDQSEAKTPHEHKTYTKEPLYTVVYAQTADGTPISYQRIYRTSYNHIQKIVKILRNYYGYGGEGYDLNSKLHVAELAKRTGIAQNTIRELLVKMASCKKIIKRKNDKWIIEHDKPYIILQQKAKHIEKEYWGRKTPVYILPFDKKYYTKPD